MGLNPKAGAGHPRSAFYKPLLLNDKPRRILSLPVYLELISVSLIGARSNGKSGTSKLSFPLPTAIPWLAIFLSVAGVLWGNLPLPAQDTTKSDANGEAKSAPSDYVLIGPVVHEVTVVATVRDKHDKILSGLTSHDFVLEEDGEPVTLSYFAHGSDHPLKMGLLIETSL
jgi:hypothetical protein